MYKGPWIGCWSCTLFGSYRIGNKFCYKKISLTFSGSGYSAFGPRKKDKGNSRRNRRAEAAAAAAAEHARKYGVCYIPVSMAKLFAGWWIISLKSD